ncbi:MAG: nicotinate phosphoribosyltransferase [Desulfobacterales bacterium]|nr:nicotinate phosphoribosyltransferase [Desulfobacterales bacterium]
MIRSILDNDLYKFTMQQAVLRLYPDALAEYRLTNRGGTPFPGGLGQKVKQEIMKMAGMGLTSDQKKWLGTTCPYFTPAYLDFLSSYRYDPGEVTVLQEGDRLAVSVKGNWCRTILWEVPLMAIISETFFAMTRPDILSREKIRERNRAKAGLMAGNSVKFVDFGTRRRFSSANHEYLIRDILAMDSHSLTGTSNVHLAKKFGLTPVGTLAHEWIMFHSALGNYSTANAVAMDAWLKIYPGVLGIALTDTYTTAVFLKDFHHRAAIFDGVRQDSGDPLAFIQTMIDHYKTLGIDPASKTIVFSDGLDPDRALAIHRACDGRIKDAYGIGTNLTNDVGTTPLNIVIKLSGCSTGPDTDWKPTVKLSDDRGKHTGDKEELLRCMNDLGID